VADDGRGHRRRRHDGQQLRDPGQRLGGLAECVVDLAAGAVALHGHRRRRLATLAEDGVDVVPIPHIGGDAPRRRVPVRKHAHIFEVGEVVADGRGRHTEREVFAEVLRADGRARGDVVLDDDPQHPLLP